MKSFKSSDFKVTKNIKLSDLSTNLDLGKTDNIEEELAEVGEELADIQDTMYSHGKYSVLLVFQGMDTSGKDSLIREVFKEFNPRGVEVNSFKTPSSSELAHDYLWRHYVALPERGKFGIFNRSHYENVLVTRVHPSFILSENLPNITSVDDITPKFWFDRMEQINNFEKTLSQNGTIILKFFLHLGKEEQRQRLLRRLEKEKHNWKFSPGDLKERESWDLYQEYYEDAINNTSKINAPWYVVPADDKPSTRLIVANIILDTMKEYKDIQEPELSGEVKDNISFYKKQLSEEKK